MKRMNALKTGVISLSIFALAGAAAPVWGAESTGVIALDEQHDAKAIEVIEKSIEAAGGRDLLGAAKHMKQTGTISIPMAGLTGTLESYAVSPDKFLMITMLPGIGEQRQGLNGGIAWSIDPMGGPRILPEEETEAVSEEADLTSRLKYKQLHPTIAYEGEVEFDGQKAHKVRLVDKKGNESIEYYSVESGHAIGNDQLVPSQMGEIKTITYLRDYKDMGGVMQPTTIVQKIGTTEVTITIKSTSYDEIDDSVFALPDAIKALAEAQKKKENADD